MRIDHTLICLSLCMAVLALGNELPNDITVLLREFKHECISPTPPGPGVDPFSTRHYRLYLRIRDVCRTSAVARLSLAQELRRIEVHSRTPGVEDAMRYAGNLLKIQKQVDCKGLLEVVEYAYDSGTWDAFFVGGAFSDIQYARAHRDSEPSPRDFTDEELKPLVVRAATDKDEYLRRTAIRVLLGSAHPFGRRPYKVTPLDRDVGQALAQQAMSEMDYPSSKILYYKMVLLPAGLSSNEYVVLLRQLVTDTNTTPREVRWECAGELHRLGQMDEDAFAETMAAITGEFSRARQVPQ